MQINIYIHRCINSEMHEEKIRFILNEKSSIQNYHNFIKNCQDKSNLKKSNIFKI
jgi:hypothetical protein